MGKVDTRLQVSAGGVAFRKRGDRIEVAVISVGDGRWQLPKGIVDKGESTESAAIREVREEAGIQTEPAGLIDKIEYWYFSKEGDKPIRFHKFVYFYLLRYRSGDVRNHDEEVNEARWVEIGEALDLLTYKSEKEIVRQARERVQASKMV